MIDIKALLVELNRKGIAFYVEDDKLKSRGSLELLTDENRSDILSNKKEIIEKIKADFSTKTIISSSGEVCPCLTPERNLLSFAQNRLWFLDGLNCGSSEYNMPLGFHIQGSLNIEVASKAIESIVNRHEILRTVIIEREAGPVQKVLEKISFSISTYNISELDADSQARTAKEIISKECLRSFDLSSDIMVRATYILRSCNDGILLFNMHHIASDGWSLGILVQEFVENYLAIIAGAKPQRAPLKVQYADYAAWQRDLNSSQLLSSQKEYWKRQLDDLPLVHSLPLDYSRPNKKQIEAGLVSSHVTFRQATTLLEFSNKRQMTPFMVLHGVLCLVLACHGNMTDVVIGTPVANRRRIELEPLIGYFANTLVLRTGVQFQTLRDYFSHIKRINLDAQENQDLPFDQLVEQLRVPRSVQHSALFQIVFSMGIDNQQEFNLPDIRITPIETEEYTTKFDLDISARLTDQGVELSWLYDRSLFKEETIRRLNDHFLRLLKLVISTSENQLLRDLTMLSEHEIAELLRFPDYQINSQKSEPVIHKVFEAQVRKNPHSAAVIFAEHTWSYTELNRKSNRLAHYLREIGIKTNMFVGIYLPRSVDLVVAILGVLKAGATYLPLEISYPNTRLSFMIRDAGLQFVLQATDYPLTADEIDNISCLSIDSEETCRALAKCPEHNLSNMISPDDIAYVNYTSGSTGQPKGILTPHQAVIRLINSPNFMKLDESTRFLQSASVSFDATTLELWGPLLNGGVCVLYPHLHIDISELNTVIKQYRINAMWLTAGLFDQWSEQLELLPDLKWVLAGGDVLNPAAIRRVQNTLPNVHLVNGYGPTENTTFTSCHVLTEISHEQNSIPIGKAVNGTQIYIVSPLGTLAPKGCAGELYVGGLGLARGYLNRPELNEEKFVRLPFASRNLYRTGDLVRYSEQDELLFLGRIDNQVKVRGYRIELGEIERQLLSLDMVASCLVTCLNDKFGGKYIAAYIIAAPKLLQNPSSLIESIKYHLYATLPEYMVPQVFTVLDEWPLTPNGKIDRERLLVPEANISLDEYVAPDKESEKIITKIWSEVLGLPESTISVTANFFSLGGHSLASTRVASEIRRGTGINVTVKDVFEFPSVQALAKLVDESDIKNLFSMARQANRDQGFPLSYVQERLWFLHLMDQKSSAYNIFSAINLNGPLSKSILQESVDLLVDRHEALRTVFENTDTCRQKVDASLRIDIQNHELQHLSADFKKEAIQTLIAEEEHRPFDLQSGALFRISLLHFGTNEYVLMLNIHHIIADGWSLNILLNELCVIYSAKTADREPVLPKLNYQYLDYSVWQREKENEKQVEDYWKHQLGGDLPVCTLPTDFEPQTKVSMTGASIACQLDSMALINLKELARKYDASLFMVLLGIFSLLLSRLGGQKDIIVGSPIAGRNHAELESIVGCFINTLALRVDLSKSDNFISLLLSVKAMCIDAYAHQEIPFERVVEIVKPERNLIANPIFDYMINMVNIPESKAGLGNISMTNLDKGDPQSKFAITLYIRELDDRLDLNFVYQKELYSSSRIKELSAQFLALTKEVLKDPICDYKHYSLHTESSRAVLPDPVKSLEKPAYPLLRSMFEDAVCRYSAYPAIAHRDFSCSYQELHSAANEIAQNLICRGMKKGEVVIVIGNRSIGLISALLGVVIAGGVILPLDVNTPDVRLTEILLSAGSSRIISIKNLDNSPAAYIESFDWNDVIHINEYGKLENSEAETDKSQGYHQIDAEDPAYIFFTSGTTGKPKGIVGKQSSLSHFLCWQRDCFGIGPGDKAAQLTSLNFDVVLRDIFLPLVSGACLHLMDDERNLSAEHLFKWMGTNGITYFHTVPTLANFWLQSSNVDFRISSLRYVFFAGEPLSLPLVNKWRNMVNGDTEIINLYGPTESTLAKSYYRVPSASKLPIVMPVGRSLPETQLLILDANGRLCTIGELGEIVVRTPFLSLGYLGNDDAKGCFKVNPFTGNANDLIYYTGDLGRYLPDGQISIFGRVDHQIKIRGMRVDLNAIKSVLLSHPKVKDAALIVINNSENEKKIVGYYVVDDDGPSAVTLRNYIKPLTASHMYPAALIRLDKLPFTSNGKLDRQRLPKVDESIFAEQSLVAYVAPESQKEVLVSAIWETLLNREKIGINENFFDVGGNSLLLLTLKNELELKFSQEINITDLFKYTTISGIADLLNKDGASDLENRLDSVEKRADFRRSKLNQQNRRRIAK